MANQIKVTHPLNGIFIFWAMVIHASQPPFNIEACIRAIGYESYSTTVSSNTQLTLTDICQVRKSKRADFLWLTMSVCLSDGYVVALDNKLTIILHILIYHLVMSISYHMNLPFELCFQKFVIVSLIMYSSN